MDQNMAVLTEMVQTGLCIQELLRILYEEFVAAVQSVDQVEDRNAKLRRDIENSQEVLVEAMGVELEAKHMIVIDALQRKRIIEKERHDASIRKILAERPPPSD